MNILRKIFGITPPAKEQFVFEPKDDITAHELSKLLPIIVSRYGHGSLDRLQTKINSLPEAVSRHLVLKPLPTQSSTKKP